MNKRPHAKHKAQFKAGRTLQLKRLLVLFDKYARADADAEARCDAGQLDPLDMEIAVSRRETWMAARHCVEMELGILSGEMVPYRTTHDGEPKRFVRVWTPLRRIDAIMQRQARAAWLAGNEARKREEALKDETQRRIIRQAIGGANGAPEIARYSDSSQWGVCNESEHVNTYHNPLIQ